MTTKNILIAIAVLVAVFFLFTHLGLVIAGVIGGAVGYAIASKRGNDDSG